jgi:hypothetical protein
VCGGDGVAIGNEYGDAGVGKAFVVVGGLNVEKVAGSAGVGYSKGGRQRWSTWTCPKVGHYVRRKNIKNTKKVPITSTSRIMSL